MCPGIWTLYIGELLLLATNEGRLGSRPRGQRPEETHESPPTPGPELKVAFASCLSFFAGMNSTRSNKAYRQGCLCHLASFRGVPSGEGVRHRRTNLENVQTLGRVGNAPLASSEQCRRPLTFYNLRGERFEHTPLTGPDHFRECAISSD